MLCPHVTIDTDVRQSRALDYAAARSARNEPLLVVVAALVCLTGCASAGTPARAPQRPDVATAAPERAPDELVIAREAYEWPFATYDEWLAFMDRAPNPAWRADAMRSLVSAEEFLRYKSQQTVTAEKIVYISDGLRINGFAIRPVGRTTAVPVVLYAHGGVAQWGRITFFDLLELYRLAEQGYVVLASALRGEGGSEGEPNLGAGDRADMLRLIDVAETLEGSDTERIGLWGFSRGGALGYRVLAATDKIDAAVLVGAPSDLLNSPRRAEFDEHVYPQVVDDYEADKDAALRRLSAAYWPERIASRTATLLLHGDADDRVRFGQSVLMAEHFEHLGRTYALRVVPGGSHALIEHQALVREAIHDWFREHL